MYSCSTHDRSYIILPTNTVQRLRQKPHNCVSRPSVGPFPYKVIFYPQLDGPSAYTSIVVVFPWLHMGNQANVDADGWRYEGIAKV
jgi:hypothetical protein